MNTLINKSNLAVLSIIVGIFIVSAGFVLAGGEGRGGGGGSNRVGSIGPNQNSTGAWSSANHTASQLNQAGITPGSRSGRWSGGVSRNANGSYESYATFRPEGGDGNYNSSFERDITYNAEFCLPDLEPVAVTFTDSVGRVFQSSAVPVNVRLTPKVSSVNYSLCSTNTSGSFIHTNISGSEDYEDRTTRYYNTWKAMVGNTGGGYPVKLTIPNVTTQVVNNQGPTDPLSNTIVSFIPVTFTATGTITANLVADDPSTCTGGLANAATIDAGCILEDARFRRGSGKNNGGVSDAIVGTGNEVNNTLALTINVVETVAVATPDLDARDFTVSGCTGLASGICPETVLRVTVYNASSDAIPSTQAVPYLFQQYTNGNWSTVPNSGANISDGFVAGGSTFRTFSIYNLPLGQYRYRAIVNEPVNNALNETDFLNNISPDASITYGPPPVADPVITITTDRPLVRRGGTVNVSWTITTVGYTASCNLFGFGNPPTLVTSSNNRTSSELFNTQQFTLSCDSGTTPGGQPYNAVSKSVTVDVVPTVQEI